MLHARSVKLFDAEQHRSRIKDVELEFERLKAQPGLHRRMMDAYLEEDVVYVLIGIETVLDPDIITIHTMDRGAQPSLGQTIDIPSGVDLSIGTFVGTDAETGNPIRMAQDTVSYHGHLVTYIRYTPIGF